ncbi:hypothetical protein MRX96_009228 [Rhipicephalus microplus]
MAAPPPPPPRPQLSVPAPLPDHPGVPPAQLPPGHPGAPLPPSHSGAPGASLPPGHPGAPPAPFTTRSLRSTSGTFTTRSPGSATGCSTRPIRMCLHLLKLPPQGLAPPGHLEAPSAAPMSPVEPSTHAAPLPPPAAGPPASAAAPPHPAPQTVAPWVQPAHPAVPKQYTAQAAGQISGTCAVATVKGAPSEPFKREYLTAVKAYEQQVGANIVRGKMFIESLPANRSVSATGMLPGMVPGTALSEIESSNNMEMGMGTGGPCGYGQHMTMGGGFGASPVGVQRSRDDFREMMNSGGGVDFAKLAEMGPQVRRLLDMGSQIDQIMDMTRMAEGSPIPMGLDSTAGRVGGPATGFGGPPPLMSDGGFDLPMRDRYCGSMMPPYGAPAPGMASAYSAERFQGGIRKAWYGSPHVRFRRLAKRWS